MKKKESIFKEKITYDKITYDCNNHYCPRSNTCEWYICPTAGEYIDDEIHPEDYSCYKKLEITIRSI